MSKKEKKDELELILEKLKKSYGENTDSDDESLSDTSAGENDEELSSMLSKLFSQTTESEAETEKVVTFKAESLEAEDNTATKAKEQADIIDVTVKESDTSLPDKDKHTEKAKRKKAKAPVKPARSQSDDALSVPSELVSESKPSTEKITTKLTSNVPEPSEPEVGNAEVLTVELPESELLHADISEPLKPQTKRPSREENEQVENVIQLMFANRGRKTLNDTPKNEPEKEPEPIQNIDDIDVINAGEEQGPSIEYVSAEATADEEEYKIYPSKDATDKKDIPLCDEASAGTVQAIQEADSQSASLTVVESDSENEALAEPVAVTDEKTDTVSEKISYVRVNDPLQGHLSDGNPAIKRKHPHTEEILKGSVAQKNREIMGNDDISLLLKLGYDEELKSEAGKERTDNVKHDIAKAFMPEKDNIPFGFCGKELYSEEQIPKIRKKYDSDKKKLLIRISAVSIITLILLFLNLTYNFGPEQSIHTAFPYFEMILMLIVCIVSFRGLISGIKGIFKFEPTVYSVSFYAVAIFYVYDIIAVIISSFSPNGQKITLFGAVAALYVLSSLLAKLADCSAESNSFKVLTSSDELYTAESFDDDFDEQSKKNREAGNFTDDNKNIRGKVFRARKTSLINGYFRRISANNNSHTGTLYLFAIIPVVSLIIGIVSLVMGNGILEALTVMSFTAYMGLPISVILYISITKFKASKLLSKNGCAVIGDRSVEEYAYAHSIIFDDSEAVEISRGIEIKPENQTDVIQSVKIVSRVFSALGGPLSELLKQTEANDNAAPPDISITTVQDSGIELYMDSSVQVLIGDRNFLSRYNIKVNNDNSVNSSVTSKTNSILYVALDGVPRLGYIVENKVKEDFIKTASMLARHNVNTIVRTYDPELNNYYFEQIRTQNIPVISVYKPSEYEPCSSVMTDSGIVAVKDCKKLAMIMIVCRRILKKIKLHKILCGVLSVIGILFSVCIFILSVIFKELSWLLAYRAVAILVFQFLGLIPVLAGHKKSFEDN